MDKIEAYEIIQSKLEGYRDQNFDDLIELVGTSESSTVSGATSSTYQVDLKIDWNDEKKECVRVEVSAADLNWYKFSPVSEHILIQRNSKG